jgi:ATP-dependent Lon protease
MLCWFGHLFSKFSVTLVEQELWQKEEKGLIGILPVRDDAEGSSIGTMINPGTGNHDYDTR